jgi:hypothetical protein
VYNIVKLLIRRSVLKLPSQTGVRMTFIFMRDAEMYGFCVLCTQLSRKEAECKML